MPAASINRSALAVAAILMCAGAPASATFFTVQYVASPVPGQSAGPLAPGLHVAVTTGAINLSNSGGSVNFSSGQFGYTPSPVAPPIVLPSNPGIPFSPPPTFVAGSISTTGTVDCEVR